MKVEKLQKVNTSYHARVSVAALRITENMNRVSSDSGLRCNYSTRLWKQNWFSDFSGLAPGCRSWARTIHNIHELVHALATDSRIKLELGVEALYSFSSL